MGLRDKVTETSRLRAWEGTIPVGFRYTAGAAGERFFVTLRARGTLAVTRCPDCGTTYVPPRLYCRDCFVDLSDHWDEVPARGTVHSYAILHRDRMGRPLSAPRTIGLVQIDGTDGALLVPLDVPAGELRVGLPVDALLKPRASREGRITDILAFRALTAGEHRSQRTRGPRRRAP